MKRLHQLLHQTNLTEYKVDLIRQYSDGRTVSSKELTYSEAHSLIRHLETYLPPAGPVPGEAMRRKIIAISHDMKWQKPDGKADLSRINEWCRKYSAQKKPLNSFKTHELPSLVSQFEILQKAFVKSIAK